VISFAEGLRFWLKLGFISFGGPHSSGTVKANWNVSAVGFRWEWEEKTAADILR